MSKPFPIGWYYMKTEKGFVHIDDECHMGEFFYLSSPAFNSIAYWDSETSAKLWADINNQKVIEVHEMKEA